MRVYVARKMISAIKTTGGGLMNPSVRSGGYMRERIGQVALQGNPLTLIGNEVKIGDRAPDFKMVANDMSIVTLSSYEGRTILLSSVPSLDTPVCDMETKRFNSEAAKLGTDVVVLTISMDLPFAQSRWCQANSASNIITLSDHREASFGAAYGVLIKELRLLARAVFIVDKEHVIRYIQLVKEIAREPDYSEVLAALQSVI
jgi:thioredoxin-dependent peroxiredoxin